MRIPDLTIKVYLTPSGYQVDFYDQKSHRLTACRDFAEDKPIKFWQDQAELAIIRTLERLGSDR